MKKGTSNITLTALFAVIIAVCSWICVPIGALPITLQTFAAALCGYVLGKGRGGAAVALYLLLGSIGLPVFSAMQGGFGVLLSPAGGFLFGFLAIAFCCGLKKEQKGGLFWGFFGIVICHLAGIIQFSLISKISLAAAFLSASLPFLVKDILCVWAAYLVAKRIKKEIDI